MRNRLTAADEETWSLRLEESKRRPLLSPWAYAGLMWMLLCAVAFAVLMFGDLKK
jgi:hypothetical protein